MTIRTRDAHAGPRPADRARATRGVGALPASARSRASFVAVLLAAFTAQLALPAAHAWSADGPSRLLATLVDAAASRGVELSGRATAPTAHDPSSCAVCQILRSPNRSAPPSTAIAAEPAREGELRAALAPRPTAGDLRRHHPPRAPPA